MAFAQIDEYFLERFHLLTRNEMIVYCFLVKAKNSGSGKCNPRQKTIADETHLEASRVSEAVKGLEEKGWAICDENGNYLMPKKVTESVRKVTKNVRNKVTENVTKVTENVSRVTENVRKIKGIENTKKRQEKKSEASSDAQAVFEFWQATLNKKSHTLTADRKRIIQARLKTKTVAQLKQAITGVTYDDWLMGRDPKSTKTYQDFETIFRNDSKVETLIALCAERQKTFPPPTIEQSAIALEMERAERESRREDSRIQDRAAEQKKNGTYIETIPNGWLKGVFACNN